MITALQRQHIARRRLAPAAEVPGAAIRSRRRPARRQVTAPARRQVTAPARRQVTAPARRKNQPLRRARKTGRPGWKDSLLFRRFELLLCTLLLALISLPLLRLAPQMQAAELALPAPDDGEGVLLSYVLPEGQGGAAEPNLDAALVESLSVASYTVRRGDTLSELSQRYRLNLDTLISYNNIRDARSLEEGALLQIPNKDGLKHTVRRGEYLGGIARKYGVDLNSLLDINNLESSVIQPGQDLFIPNARLSSFERNRVLGHLFVYPTRGRITSRFGTRSDPFTGVRRFHNGVDIANLAGTGVKAAMEGRVAMTGYNSNYGKYIILTHPEGFQSLYGHLDTFNVQKGETVQQGQVIGRMGNTGYSTGSHLHFSIFKKGEPVDPFSYLH
jgi:murein DD-endopeptidase MepM/ murein hydrolase activator NlpD